MTYKELNNMVAEIGLPYAYYEFPKDTEQAPPFVCFLLPSSEDFAADNRNYQRMRPCRIELYTDNKDFDLEQAVEYVLNAHDLFYRRAEGYLDSEQMNMVAYDFVIVVTDERRNINA